MKRKEDIAALARRLAQALSEQPANDDEPEIDREAIRERARRHAERMRRARGQR